MRQVQAVGPDRTCLAWLNACKAVHSIDFCQAVAHTLRAEIAAPSISLDAISACACRSGSACRLYCRLCLLWRPGKLLSAPMTACYCDSACTISHSATACSQNCSDCSCSGCIGNVTSLPVPVIHRPLVEASCWLAIGQQIMQCHAHAIYCIY